MSFIGLGLGLGSNLSTNDDSFSVGPSHPDIIGLPTGVGLCILVRV